MLLSDIARAFYTRSFGRWLRKSGLRESALRTAVKEMEAGLVDVDLGGGLFKKRLPLPGRGKRGGARTLVVVGAGHRWFFLYGYAKNERADIEPDDLMLVREQAEALLLLTPSELSALLAEGSIKEAKDENKD